MGTFKINSYTTAEKPLYACIGVGAHNGQWERDPDNVLLGGWRCLCSTSPARSAVLEWQVVTVAWFHSSRSCIGAPTILLRPITTALFPATDTPVEKQSIHQLIIQFFVVYFHSTGVCFFRVLYLPVCLINSMQPFGVQGMKQSPRSPRDSFPAFMLVSL